MTTTPGATLPSTAPHAHTAVDLDAVLPPLLSSLAGMTRASAPLPRMGHIFGAEDRAAAGDAADDDAGADGDDNWEFL
eukprot:CAMPEP_0194284200 /NCGR_PEP_ID=MMETSP0169-20130528/27004_1 /TAXON_ID=218684 /ORGANISM="Corethron pennatum, Strain L29A3" /LENGTH=77 /DNA_ID=CAMNT_0039029953 /DNA_START=64 /DNA_END=293 /DNA_ORIENTATION=-